MNKLLTVAAIGEIATGLALLIAPSLVASLLLGEPLAGVAIPVARVAGIAVYLAWLGFAGGFVGPLLWPAVMLHLILTALLAVAASG